jgi:MoaA/NifB/PqqE/SkfB family radical SAM enzyme/glycosyltransferase involved in cell wall biosynthesis
LNICILTRSDIIPTDHGAAVKIVETAHSLSRLYQRPVFVVVEDRDYYHRFCDGQHTKTPYSSRVRAMEEWFPLPFLERFAERICTQIGYPKEEFFLYKPQFDPSWVVRALAVGQLEKIDVFQAEFPGYGIPAVIASRLLGMMRVWKGGRRPISSIVQHNVEWDRLAEFGHKVSSIRRMEVLSLRLVDEVIAVSADDKRRMVAAGVEKNKITIIPHGVDTRRFSIRDGLHIREQHGITRTDPVLIFHGTLHYWPNYEAVRFIRSRLLLSLLDTYPDLKIFICGMNPPLEFSHPSIIFTGSVLNLEEYIAAADVCICPLFAGGGTRLKLLEYMAVGKPTVSTSKGAEGIPMTGQMIIADTASEMIQQIGVLLDNPAHRATLGNKASRFVATLDWNEVSKAYIQLYSGLGRGKDWSIPSLDIESHLPARTPSKDRTLLLLINKGCNLRCSFCDLWEGKEQIPLMQVKQILDDAVSIETRVLVITGGEPLLHNDVFHIIEEANLRGLSVNMTTNGTLIDRYWDSLCTAPLDSLSFSIDGIGDTHDELRGQKGAFEKTISAIKRVRAELSCRRSIYFVATNKNVHQLIDVFELSLELGCSFDFWPVNDAEDLYITDPKDVQKWEEAVSYIAQRSKRAYENMDFYRDGMRYHAHQLQGKSMRCLGLIDQYGITYDGWLLPCCVWGKDDLRVGNVFETPLRTLWKSTEVQKHRTDLYERGCDVGCFNHSLYEFSASTGEDFLMPQEDKYVEKS